MGMFSFIKNVGSSVFKGGNDAGDIEKLLGEELSGKIEHLKAEVSDGIAKIHGICDSIPTKEKAVLLTGNIKGIEQVDGDNLTVSSLSAPASEQSELIETQESEFYEIVSGDTLSKIAKQYYGNANKYPLIFEANREVIKHPDKIYPGQKIRIPKLR